MIAVIRRDRKGGLGGGGGPRGWWLEVEGTRCSD